MDNEEKLHKEIDLIQGCIVRMANNSFMIKGWVITIVVALFAFFNTNVISYKVITAILIIIIFTFWFLDAFYLQTEKKYRALYNRIIKIRQEGNTDNFYDLTLPKYIDGTNNAYDANGNKNTKVSNILSIMFSRSLLIFFGMLILLTVIYFCYFHYSYEHNNTTYSLNNYNSEIATINVNLDDIDKRMDKIVLEFEEVFESIYDVKEKMMDNKSRLQELEVKIENMLNTLANSD